MKVLCTFFFFLFSLNSYAQEVRYLLRSPKALLMGDAYTSLADDDYTLFYNPAALARSSAFEIRLLNPTIGISNLLDDMDRFDNFPADAVGINDRIQGIPIHTQVGVAPGLKMGGFLGFNFIANNSTTMMLKNAVHPELDIDYRYDRGFVVGGAYTIGMPPALRGKGADKGFGSTTSFGFSLKYITREGIDNSFDLFGTKLLSDIASGVGDIDTLKESLGYSKGSSTGFDLGFLHSIQSGGTELNFAASILDIGGMSFEKESGTANIPDQDMMVNIGTSLVQSFGPFDATFALDLHPLNAAIPFGRKVHLGMKLGIPLIDVMAGWNAGYLNYGVGLNLWPIRILAGFYNVEIGADFKQEQAKRAVIYFSLFETSFNL